MNEVVAQMDATRMNAAWWLLFPVLVGVVIAIARHFTKGAVIVAVPAPVPDDGSAPSTSLPPPPDGPRCYCGAPAVRNVPLVGVVRPFVGLAYANPLRVETDPNVPRSLCLDHEAIKRAEAERFIALRVVDFCDQRTKLARDCAEFNARQNKIGL